MKSAITRGLGLAIVMLGFLAAAPMAYAQITNHAGAICKNSSRGDATLIEYLNIGTRSYKTSATNIVCPLTRDTTNSNGAWVYVDITHTGTQTTSCTAYSYSENGSILGATVTGNQTFSGFREFALNLTGPGKSTAWSDYSVKCSIPGNGNAIIHGVDLSEI